MATETKQKWSEEQLKYIAFVSRGKTTKTGEKSCDEDFAKAIGVGRTTLWRWQHLDGFAEAVFEASMKSLIPMLPHLNAAMVGKSVGQAKFKYASEKAYLALMRQFSLLKSDKIDHTTNGRDLPTPMLAVLPPTSTETPNVAQ